MDFRDRARELFLHRHALYTRKEAAELLDITEKEFERVRFEPERGDAVAWREVALVAVGDWPMTEIEAALGPDFERGVPKLCRTVDVTIRLRECDLLRVQHLAKKKGVSLDQYVGNQTRPDFNIVAEQLESTHPGIVEASRFPYHQ